MNFWSVYIALTLFNARTLVSCLPTCSVIIVATACYEFTQASLVGFRALGKYCLIVRTQLTLWLKVQLGHETKAIEIVHVARA